MRPSRLRDRRQRLQMPRRLVPHGGALERQHDAELRQQAAQPVDGGGAFLDEPLAHPVHGEQGLLLGRLHRHEAHGGAAGRLADGGRIVGVVLALPAAHPVRADELGGDQPRRVTEVEQPARPVVRTRTRFHRHDARRYGRQHLEQLLAPHAARQQHLAGCIDTVHSKHVLG
jgi:hypothetical protein